MLIVSVHEKMFTNLVIQLCIEKKEYKKMFVNAPRFVKSANSFFREQLPIYDIIISYVVVKPMVILTLSELSRYFMLSTI